MSAPRIYIDSNVFIAAYEHLTARSDHAIWLLSAVEDGRVEAVTSELTLSEILVRPLQEGASDVVRAYEAVISPAAGFAVGAVERAVLIEAARIRAERPSIRLPDAIHLATARRHGCSRVVSDDGRLSTRDGPATVALGPFTLDVILNGAG